MDCVHLFSAGGGLAGEEHAVLNNFLEKIRYFTDGVLWEATPGYLDEGKREPSMVSELVCISSLVCLCLSLSLLFRYCATVPLENLTIIIIIYYK